MNQQQSPQPTKKSSATTWVILVVVVIIIGVGAYFFLTQEEETSTNINITKNINSAVNENVNGVANTNTVVAGETIQFPDAEVLIACEQNDDCRIFDTTESLSDCCPTPDCRNWYTQDEYVAVNLESYNKERLELRQENNCDAMKCPYYSSAYCPPGEPYAVAECQDSVCIKVIK